MYSRRVTLSVCTLALVAGTAVAQPRAIVTPLADDLSAGGDATVGRLVETVGGATVYTPYIWRRGQGYTRVGAWGLPAGVRGSSDLSTLTAGLDNLANWGSLNCFNGYCFGSMTGCTPGQPRSPLDPCIAPPIAHRYTQSSGWVNTGSFTRIYDAATGRYYGGTHCTTAVNTPYDISGDGRYVVGGGWWSSLLTATGGPAFGLCGEYHAFRYDGVTGEFAMLPSVNNSKTTRADRVNNDGTVITGYNLTTVNNPSGSVDSFRHPCVWTNGVQSILVDAELASVFPVNGPGTVIAGNPPPAWNLAHLGSAGIKLVRWVRGAGDTWTPQNLGRPADRDNWFTFDVLAAIYPEAVSDDGNTIVGTAQYNAIGPTGLARAFIWRPSINGGVPIDLLDYVAQLDPASPLLAEGVQISGVKGVSADGRAVLLSLTDGRNTCEGAYRSAAVYTTCVLYIDGAPVPCEPPTIAAGPTDYAATVYYAGLGAAMNVAASGGWPLNFQWQREDPSSPGTWTDLVQDCSAVAGSGYSPTFSYEATLTNQLRIGTDPGSVCARTGRYRVVVSNSCGSVVSEPATFSVAPAPYVVQPSDVQVDVGGTAVFTVANAVPASSAVARWMVESPEGSGAFVTLVGSHFFEGATGLEFDLEEDLSSTGGYRYLTLTNIQLGTHSPLVYLRNQIDAYAFGCGGHLDSRTAVMTVGPTCGRADLGRQGGLPGPDGLLDNNDFVVFIDYFFAQSPLADFGVQGGVPGSDGQFDNNDFVVFIDFFFAGC